MTKPEDVGLSSSRIERIRPAIERYLGEEKIAGVVTLLARRGLVAHLESFGLAGREQGQPMQSDCIFRLCSMTKPVTVVALLILLEQGKVRLTDPVSRFIPEFAGLKVVEDESSSTPDLVNLERPVTIWHLLTHTAGLTYHTSEYGCVERMYREAEIFSEDPLSVFVGNLARMPLAFQPGTTWRYGVGHDVAARIVEIAGGKEYDAFLREYIFAPLGMSDTGFYVPEAGLPRLTSEYGYADWTEPRMTSTNWMGGEAPESRLIRGPGNGLEAAQHNIFRGGHGLVSTAMDYFRFCQMLLSGGSFHGERVLSRKTVELMTANHLSPGQFPADWWDPGLGFGLGVRVSVDPARSQMLGTAGEHGWAGAAGTYYWIDPAEEFIGIIMFQFQPGDAFQLAGDFRTAAYQAIDD